MCTSKVYVVSFSIFDKNHFIKPQRETNTMLFLVTKISRKSYLIFFISDLHVVRGFICYFDSWPFIKPKIERRKTQFLATKRKQNSYVICLFIRDPKNYGWFHLLFLTQSHFIKRKIESHKTPFLVTKRNQTHMWYGFFWPVTPKL